MKHGAKTIVSLLLMCFLVFGYGALDGRIESMRHVASLSALAFFLFGLLELKDLRFGIGTMVLSLVVAILTTIAVSITWEMDGEKSLLVGLVNCALAITSRWWLRFM